ncbi:MAG: radical SAM protein [Candidatus Omnitrophota bacterium]
MDRFQIDSHKLMYHVSRVSSFASGESVYPIYVEISPSGSCNHRCVFCAYDFVGYKPRLIDADILIKRLSEMARLGVKSVLYSGEGEPLLHPEIGRIAASGARAGIDSALATNAVLFTMARAVELLPHMTWIKVSINAGTSATYERIHRAHPGDFAKVMENMTYAVSLRKKKKYRCTLGMQILLLPENYHQVRSLAVRAKAIGMDYLVVKPYSHHPLSITRKYRNIKYADYLECIDGLRELNDERFEVIARLNTMKKWDEKSREYDCCYALNFWAHIDSAGVVWGCPMHFNDKRFKYGSIYQDTFKNIWNGAAKRKLLSGRKSFSISGCRINCRMDEINKFLWKLKNPPEHVNFV